MKSKDRKELHQKTVDELVNMLMGAKEDLWKRNLDKAQKKLKNTAELFHVRKKVARLKTILREKELSKNA